MPAMTFSRKPINLPEATMLVSPPGVGKTELAAYFPSPFFMMISRDMGLLTLIKNGRVPQDIMKFDKPFLSWPAFLDGLDMVRKEQHDCKSLVIDTGNGLQYVLKEHLVEEQYGGDDSKFLDYGGKGWPLTRAPWTYMLGLLDGIRLYRGMRVIMLMHSVVGKVNNPDGDDYHTSRPELHPELYNLTNGWADNVLYANLEACTVKEKGQATKLKSADKRLLYVHSTGAHFAKNRWGLKGPISMGTCGRDAYGNLKQAIVKAMEKNSKPDAPPEEEESPETKPEPIAQVSQLLATWAKRIAATKKFPICLNLFAELVGVFDHSTPEVKAEVIPTIILQWVERCKGLAAGDADQLEMIETKLNERMDLPADAARLILAQPG